MLRVGVPSVNPHWCQIVAFHIAIFRLRLRSTLKGKLPRTLVGLGLKSAMDDFQGFVDSPHVSSVQNPSLSHSMKSWLVHRDPSIIIISNT